MANEGYDKGYQGTGDVRMTKPNYDDILKARKALMSAEVPMDNRVMYYYVISWWKHPIKRFKQIRQVRSLLKTTAAEDTQDV